MRILMICAVTLALAACNETNLESEGQQLGAKADRAVSNVNGAVDELGEDLENVAASAETAAEKAADSIDRQIDKVENAAEAADRELDK